MTNSRKPPVGTLLLFGIFGLVMLATYILVKPTTRPAELEGILRPEFRPLQPFELTDHKGAVFNQQRLQGKWTFVFFGYTSCPDICPTTLYVLNSVMDLLENTTAEVQTDTQTVFVSVDPERDTTELLANYVPYFNSTFIGATADKTEIDRLTRQFGAGYIIEPETSPGQYAVAHTSAIFLVDPSARLVASFSQPHYAENIALQYARILAFFRS